MDSKKTGALIAEARKEKNMTQRELASALHVSDRAVSKWERGVGFPDVSLLEPLADALGLTVTELLHGEKYDAPELGDREVRYALKIVRQRRKAALKRNLRDILGIIISLVIFGFFAFHFADKFGAFSDDIYLELDAGVYVNGVRVEDTKVVIDGRKNNYRGNFWGHVAIDYLEKSCRDGTYADIWWNDEGQVIGYFGYGKLNFVPVDRYCYFSSNMASFAIENTDEGWIIATHDYLAELMALDGYYPLLEPGRHHYSF